MSEDRDESRVIDFDAFRREQEGDPLLLRIGDREYELPASPPAIVALRALRLAKDGLDTVPPDQVYDLAVGIFGEERLMDIAGSHALTVPELTDLIQEVMRRYQAATTPPPNRETRRATRSSPSR